MHAGGQADDGVAQLGEWLLARLQAPPRAAARSAGVPPQEHQAPPPYCAAPPLPAAKQPADLDAGMAVDMGADAWLRALYASDLLHVAQAHAEAEADGGVRVCVWGDLMRAAAAGFNAAGVQQVRVR